MLRHDTAGDPCSGLRWVRRSTRRLASRLTELGLPASPRTVARLLRAMRFSLRVNRKYLPIVSHKDRNTQFELFAALRRRCDRDNIPVVSVDTKKRELVGLFKNAGTAWRQSPVNVLDHDFRSLADGIAVPYGIYDTRSNSGFVVVGTSRDTPFFAVSNLRRWWRSEGALRYPHASSLVVLADCGGSNGYRPRAWKHQLQHAFCNPFRIAVTVAHYPAGCSKYNPIEHRLFSEISKNWAGQPLESYELILQYIASTSTRTGLSVSAHLSDSEYQTGIKISDRQMRRLNIVTGSDLPNWNYTIKPTTI